MKELLVVGLAVGAGVDLRVVGALSFAILFPVWALVAVLFHVTRSKSSPSIRSAVFCQTVSRELLSGTSLRWALAAAAWDGQIDEVYRAVDSGEGWEEVGVLLEREFSDIGTELALVVKSVAASGSQSGSLFAELGDLALAQVEMAEEIRVATAPARSSAMILIGLPILYLGYQFKSGQLGELLALESSRGLAGIGLILFLLGIGVSFALVRGSR